GAAHVANLVTVEAPRAVHGAAVVPHHEIVDLPGVRVHELALGRVLGEIAQEYARLRHRPALDGSRVGGEEERLSAGDRMHSHDALAHWVEGGELLRGEVDHADRLARVAAGGAPGAAPPPPLSCAR